MMYDNVTIRKSLVHNISTQADILSKAGASALAFDDQAFAATLLNGLEADSHIIGACIFAADGAVFARFSRDRADYQFPPVSDATMHQFGKGYLDIFHPIIFANEQVGTIFIRTDLHEISDRFKQYLLIAVCIFMISIIAAMLLSVKFQQFLTRPVDELGRTAKLVTVNKDYSVRAVKYSEDALGILTDAFNEMMTEIQERDAVLQNAHEELQISQKTFSGFFNHGNIGMAITSLEKVGLTSTKNFAIC